MADIRTIDGLDDVLRRLGAMPLEVRTKALPRAASKGAAIFRDAAKRLAPVEQPDDPKRPYWTVFTHKPGTLRDSIKVRKNRRPKPGVSVSYSAATGKEAFYADFLEFGFEHVSAGWVQVPFMRPAFDANRGRALQAFLDELKLIADNVGKL
jgi:HK97 gp10 family phage protein